MSILIADDATTADVIVGAGESVSLVLVSTAGTDGVPKGAYATVSWKGAGASPTLIAVIGTVGVVLEAEGTFQVDKSEGAFQVERS